jgi:hypothetical protein
MFPDFMATLYINNHNNKNNTELMSTSFFNTLGPVSHKLLYACTEKRFWLHGKPMHCLLQLMVTGKRMISCSIFKRCKQMKSDKARSGQYGEYSGTSTHD